MSETENKNNSKCGITNGNENMTIAVEIHVSNCKLSNPRPPNPPPPPKKTKKNKKKTKKDRNSGQALQLDSNSWPLFSEPDTISVYY